MKCLCMTAEHTTINLTPAELTGQKPMQPLLGTEHYQCMDSLFIRGSIRHHSLRCHAGYETDSQQVNAVSHTTLPTVEQYSRGIMVMHVYTAAATPENSQFMFVFLVKLRVCTILSKFPDYVLLLYKPSKSVYLKKMQEANFKVKLMYLLFSFN